MKRYCSFLTWGLLCAVLNAGCTQKKTADDTVTISDIRASVDRIGGKATVNAYFFDSSAHHQPALAQIETGAKEWVDLGVEMMPYLDAGSTTDILSALGAAMQHQPANVLPYVNTPYRPDQICYPFVSADIPANEQLAIVRRSKQALLTVRDPLLKKQCDLCLKEVARLERVIQADKTIQTKPVE